MRWVLGCVTAIAAVVPGPASAGADLLKRACTAKACVDVWTEGGSAAAGYAVRARVTNQDTHTLLPTTFRVEYDCQPGRSETRTLHVREPVPAGESADVSHDQPVCVGASTPPAGVRVSRLPGSEHSQAPFRYRGPLDDHADPFPHAACFLPCVFWLPWHDRTTSTTCLTDPLPPLPLPGTDQPDLPDAPPPDLPPPPKPEVPDLPSGGGGGSKELGPVIAVALAVAAAVAAVVVVVVTVTAVVWTTLVLGAGAGVALGWGLAKVLQRRANHWIVNIALMDGPLLTGAILAALAVALGTVSLVPLAAVKDQRVQIPAAAALVTLTAGAAITALALAPLVGVTAVTAGTLLLAPPEPQPTSASSEEPFVEARPVVEAPPEAVEDRVPGPAAEPPGEEDASPEGTPAEALPP